MEHPNLTQTEAMIVRRTRIELLKVLAKSDVPHDRWQLVTLGVVVDLAGQTLDLHEQHGEPLPAKQHEGASAYERTT